MRGTRAACASLLVIAGCGLDVVGAVGVDGGAAITPGPTTSSSSSSSGSTAEVEAGAGAEGGAGGVVDAGQAQSVVPSHVTVAIDPNAPDVSGVVAIDSTDRKVKTTAGQLTNVRFEAIDGKAVLFVRRWDVDLDVMITGNAPLVVLAAGPVTIAKRLDAGGHAMTPGPGGSAADLGPGHGLVGVPSGTDDPGGGGAGHATAGAAGGNGSAVNGGAPGAAYGGKLADFGGGSGGGHGTPFQVSPCTTEGAGGVGGGALQITSRASINVTSTGLITTGGGGGRGGCLNGGDFTMSGGGGGSGGTLFLEAPMIKVDGVLAANGGGGGGGAQSGTMTAGQAGQDGQPSLSIASGGTGSVDRAGGSGGTGDAAPITPPGKFNNAGGGGGASGFIWLRTRGTNPTVKTSSPAASIDTTL